MGERNQTSRDKSESADDFFDPLMGDLGEEEFEDLDAGLALSDKAALCAKRRRAEQRLEALKLREEIGDYDFDFDDF